MNELIRRVVVMLFVSLLAIPVPSLAETTQHTIRVGLWPYHSARYLLSYYEGLRSQLEHNLKRPVRLEVAPSVMVFAERMSRGDYDFAVMAPHMGRLAQQDYGWQPVARYLPDSPLYILTHRNSGLRSLAQLKGKTIAIPERQMLISLQAMKAIREGGVPDSSVKWRETGGVASSVFDVISGQSDAVVASLASLAVVPQDELDQLKVLQDIGTVPQMVIMAAPHVSSLDVGTAMKACVLYRPNGKQVIGHLNARDLAGLDGYAEWVRNQLQGHLAPISNAKQRKGGK